MDVLALLEAKGFAVTPKGGDEYSITCPNQAQHAGGIDKNPSCNVNVKKMKLHCLVCGFKMGEVGLTKWLLGDDLDDTQIRTLKLRSSVKKIREDIGELTLVEPDIDVMFPVGEPWDIDGYRGISLETYRKVGAVKVDRGRYSNRICFPVVVDGKLLGVDARALGDEQPKYLRNKSCSCKQDWLFPFDIVKGMQKTYIILAEGIFHALNGVDKGYPTCAIFGTNNWSETKLLKLLDLDVSEVIYFRDEDKAGRQAEQWICSTLSKWFDVHVIEEGYIPDGKDLGDLSAAEIENALEHRRIPKLPACMKNHPWNKPKIIYDSICYDKRCPFCVKGICKNALHKLEGAKD